jgi:agmatine deiminase
VTDIDLTEYRWPAEWETHKSTWVSWPVNKATWPGIFARIPAAFAEFVATIARFERVNILVGGVDVAREVQPLIDAACDRTAATFEVCMVDIQTDDAWCRDYGPIFLNAASAAAEIPSQIAIDWGYNAWGGKYPPWDRDAAVTEQIARHQSVPRVQPGAILEGGAVDGNGRGTVITTESSLLNAGRNPRHHRSAMEAVVRKFFGVDTVVWLPGGGIPGDDTDGHVDQLARFTDEQTVVVAAACEPDAPEAVDLRANYSEVAEARNNRGVGLRPVELRMPSPKFQQGRRVPASYCNFYIVNDGVIVPLFNDSADDEALQVLQSAFPGRLIVGIDATDLVWGLGAFHCMTQQQPTVKYDGR